MTNILILNQYEAGSLKVYCVVCGGWYCRNFLCIN